MVTCEVVQSGPAETEAGSVPLSNPNPLKGLKGLRPIINYRSINYHQFSKQSSCYDVFSGQSIDLNDAATV